MYTKRTITNKFLLILFSFLLLDSCQLSDQKIKIGFSQCDGGEWREQMNQEMLSETRFYDNVDLLIKTANGNIDKQIADIKDLSSMDLDLLIISPLEDTVMIDVFKNLDQTNIPVVLIDRKVSTNKYTSYIGGSNIQVGRMAAEYVRSIKGDTPTEIFQIKGYDRSTATFEREIGFVETLKPYGNFKITTVVAGRNNQWDESVETKDILLNEVETMKRADVVYAFNDAIALVAYDILKNANVEKMPIIIGVDGMLGYGKGINAVRDGMLSATVVYPTCGHYAIDLAMKIIGKKSVPKENIMPTVLINKENVLAYHNQALISIEQQQKIDLQQKSLSRINQKNFNLLVSLIVLSVLLLLIICICIYLAMRVVHMKKKDDSYKMPQEEREQLDLFKKEIQNYVEKHYMDIDMDLNCFIDEMSLSRVAFYKKFKSVFQDTPSSYVKEFRLKKSKEFILMNKFTYAEIAYKVGFSSPAYFTKCFKDEYGETPSQYFERKSKKKIQK